VNSFRGILIHNQEIQKEISDFINSNSEIFNIRIDGSMAICPIEFSIDDILTIIASVDLQVNHGIKMFLR
jgi:hypothetical protein